MHHPKLKLIINSALTVVVSTLIIFGVARAGSLTPSASPAATLYTLGDIYTRLTTNATATVGNHVFAPAGSPASSLYTLTQIYSVIPTIDATLVKLGTTYLGVAGSLTPEGAGTAGGGDLFSGKTTNLTNDWTLDTGTLNLACNTSTFDGTYNLVANGYDGSGNGSNRWCITDSGDAVAGNILLNKIAWVDGVALTGTMANNGAFGLSASSTDQSVTAGYYSGGTLSGDADLVTGNIKSGVNIFGVAGNVIQSLGNAIAGNVLAGTTFSNATTANVAGAMTNVGVQTITPSTSNTAITQGYHDGTGYCAGDADLVTGNIKSGVNLFGVAGTLYGDTDVTKVGVTASASGTLLMNLFNGSTTTFPGGSQANGGIDDLNGAASDRYSKGWTQCTSGADNYCGTGDSNADARDDSTGLIFSKPCGGSGTTCTPTSESSPTTYTWANAKTACTNMTGWFLPHQRQLMMAYIDGAYNNLDPTNSNSAYWSATTLGEVGFTTYAFYVNTNRGDGTYYLKTLILNVRCVR